MINRIERVFSIRRNEAAPASLLFFYLFIVIGAFVMGQSVGDTLFLNVYPKHLPYAMIGSSMLSATFVMAYIRLSHRLRLEWLVVGTLAFFALSFCWFWWMASFARANWVYLLIYIWVQTEGAMGPMMGWTLANFVLTTREARRVFGFIQLGAILGVPFVGFVTADLMHSGRVKPPTLLLVLALMMATCGLLVIILFRTNRQRLAEVRVAGAAGREAPKNLRQSLTLIRQSRYLLLMTVLVAIGCLASAILVYQFKLIAKASYGADKAGLTAFFSRFYAYMGLVTFLVQLLATRPLLRTFGIRITLFALPFALLFPTAGVLLAPGLLTASLMRATHYGLRYSLDKSSTELLYLPVGAEIKSQVKSFIDTFVYRLSDGVAGGLLLLFAGVLSFSPGKVSMVNLVILLTWIAIALGVRRQYLNVLRRAIERRTLDPERTAAGLAGVLDSTTSEALAMSFERAGEEQVLYGLSLFEMGRDPTSHPALRRLLEHPSPAVRQRALRLLGDAGDLEIRPRVEKMLADESPEVRTEALHYLVAHTGRDPLTLLEGGAGFTDYSLPGSVVVYLARTGQPDNVAAAGVVLQGLLSQTGPDGARARLEAARALGAIPAPFAPHTELPALLADESIDVQEQALLSAGKIQGRQFLPLVIEKLGERRLRGAARAALAPYGDHAVGTLQDYLNDDAVAMAVRKQIPNVLARIASPASAAALAHSLVQADAGLRYDLLKALNKVRRRDPELVPSDADFGDMLEMELMGYNRSLQILEALEPRASAPLGPARSKSVLTRALRERMDYEFERVFRLLALIYPPRDIYNAYVGVRSGRPQLHANALEVLEHLLKPAHYRTLAYALDPEIGHAERLSFAQRLCHVGVNSKVEALRILVQSDDRWLRACALHEIGESVQMELFDEVQQVPHQGDPLLEETWKWTRAHLAPGATV